jgi:L-amino acid N-acyltransferase YncA
MKLLLDTNILIPIEPTDPSHIEAATPSIAELVRLATGPHSLFVHPASKAELAKDADTRRREARAILLRKYSELPAPPVARSELRSKVGTSDPGSHDVVDLALLAAVDADAVDLLVTDDVGLQRKAERVGLGDRVLTSDEALRTLESLLPREVEPPPAVKKLLAHELDASDPIFESFRQDYPGFDAWLSKCRREHRPAWVVFDDDRYGGVAIVKQEAAGEHGLAGRLLKLCSFKTAFGRGLGELLLKTVLKHASALDVAHVYVEVLEKHGGLIKLFEQFGFVDQRVRTKKGERVLSKRQSFSREEYERASALEFNILYGPFVLKVAGTQAFIVPVRPRYHRLLFPELEAELFPCPTPSGNAIRKAYLCHASTRELPPGAPLLFYRSRDRHHVSCIGVADRTLRSSNADRIARLVGTRTVYSYEEIQAFCRKDVLAILFRHARVLDKPWTIGELRRNGVIRQWPQSIVRVSEEGMKWLERELDPLP